MGRVLSINISDITGIEKTQVKEVKVIENWGLKGDAHAGEWDRQVSIFPVEALDKVPRYKLDEVLKGGYTENFTISGVPLEDLVIGKTVKIGEAYVKILYIGKEVPKEKGRPYIVSREGRFGIVVEGGKVKTGDEVRVISEQNMTLLSSL